MKCGVDIPENQVFCDHCLSVMDTYPIKPDVRVHLPKREDLTEEQKKPAKKKRVLSLEEQISSLRLKVLRLRLVAVVLAFILCVVSSFLVLKLYQDSVKAEPGRNYTIDTTMND
jgi:hypothetical protein